MKISNWTRLTRDGRLAEAPEWIDDLIDPLNEQMENLTTALQGRLGVENENAVVIELGLNHDTPIAITTSDVRGQATEVRVIQVDDGSAVVGFAWQVVSESEVTVRVLFEDAPPGTKTVRLKIRGE